MQPRSGCNASGGSHHNTGNNNPNPNADVSGNNGINSNSNSNSTRRRMNRSSNRRRPRPPPTQILQLPPSLTMETNHNRNHSDCILDALDILRSTRAPNQSQIQGEEQQQQMQMHAENEEHQQQQQMLQDGTDLFRMQRQIFVPELGSLSRVRRHTWPIVTMTTNTPDASVLSVESPLEAPHLQASNLNPKCGERSCKNGFLNR